MKDAKVFIKLIVAKYVAKLELTLVRDLTQSVAVVNESRYRDYKSYYGTGDF